MRMKFCAVSGAVVAAAMAVTMGSSTAAFAKSEDVLAGAATSAEGVTVTAERARTVVGPVGPAAPVGSGGTAASGPAGASAGTAIGWGVGADQPWGDASAPAEQWLPYAMTDSGPQECLGPQGRSRTENCRTRIGDETTAVDEAAESPATPAAGGSAAPAVDWRVVVDRAVLALNLPEGTPQIGPDPAWNEWKALAVGFPLWLWADTAPRDSTTTNDGITVHIHARAEKTVFTMGDGRSVTCTAMTAYNRATTKPGASSPTCGYTYATRRSFVVSATTTWRADWSANGASGSLTVQKTATRPLTIIELESVITG